MLALALALGCAPGGGWDGTWLVRVDAQADRQGDCTSSDDPFYEGEDNGTFEVYSLTDGVAVDLGYVILRGVADGDALEADWESDDGATASQIEVNAKRDGDTIRGNFTSSSVSADYECFGSTDFTGTRVLDTNSHLD